MKYYGRVGVSVSQETVPGVWEDTITEEYLYGDVIRDIHRNDSSGEVNDNLGISNTISVLASPFIMGHVQSIRYIEWLGSLWKVTSIDVQPPRLILSLGGVYNGSTAAPSESGDSSGNA